MSLPSNMWIAVRFFPLVHSFQVSPAYKVLLASYHICSFCYSLWNIAVNNYMDMTNLDLQTINALSVKHNLLSLLLNTDKVKLRNTPRWLVKFVFRFYTTMVLTECLINIEINSFPLLKKDFEHMLKDELYHSCCSLNLLHGPEPATKRDNVQFPNIKERVSRFPRNLHPCLHCFFHDKIWLPRDLL